MSRWLYPDAVTQLAKGRMARWPLGVLLLLAFVTGPAIPWAVWTFVCAPAPAALGALGRGPRERRPASDEPPRAAT